MSEVHPAMNASVERRAWSTSGYLIFVAFLMLLALTAWRIIAFAGSEPADSEVFGFVVSAVLAVIMLIAYPWEFLSIVSVIYLALIPVSIRARNRLRAADARAAQQQ